LAPISHLLFSRTVRLFVPRALRAQTFLVSQLFALLPSPFHPMGPRPLPPYVLLLRGAYYKSFWADPPACAVSEPRQNLSRRTKLSPDHGRIFIATSCAFPTWCGLSGYDAVMSFHFPNGFGIGVGSIVLVVNVVLLGGYVFGCHAFRHLIGGTFDRISEHPVRHKLYDCVSCLNAKHQKWAWASLFWVGFSDIYVRLCSMGSGTTGESCRCRNSNFSPMTYWSSVQVGPSACRH